MLRRHSALVALVAAGLLWGLTVPLSKLVLEWLDGGTLTVVRFALAAPLLAFAARKHLRAAFTPRILAAGAVGYGIVIVLQNAGIGHDQRQPRVADRRRHAGARRAGRGRHRPRQRRPAGLGRLRARAGGRGDRRRRRRRRRVAQRRRARPAVGRAVSATFVVVQPSLLRRARPVRGDRGADDRRRRSPRCPNALLEGLPHAPASATPVLALAALVDRRHGRAVRALRLRAVARGAGAGRHVPQPRAARRHGRGRAGVRRSVRPAAAARRRGDPAGIALSTHAAQAARGGRVRSLDRRGPPRPARCGSPHPQTPGNSLTADRASGNLRIKQHPSSLSPHMTLLAPRPDRSLTPHTFVVPVVRELPSSSTPSRLPASPPPPCW